MSRPDGGGIDHGPLTKMIKNGSMTFEVGEGGQINYITVPYGGFVKDESLNYNPIGKNKIQCVRKGCKNLVCEELETYIATTCKSCCQGYNHKHCSTPECSANVSKGSKSMCNYHRYKHVSPFSLK